MSEWYVVKANEETVSALFRTDVRLIVPRYQRKYVWSLQNWAVLWNDILAAMTPRADGTADLRHFLGAVVLRSQSVGGVSTMVERDVIDGQQRLATLQVLFAAVREAAQACGVDARYIATLRKLTYNDDEMSPKDEKFKLQPTRYDWEAFRAAMEPEPGPAVQAAKNELAQRRSAARGTRRAPATPLSRHPLVLARAHFAEAAREWLGRGRPDARMERLLTLVNHGLRLIVIDLDPADNPQHIFESLNVKAVPLEAADLVRNHVFQVIQAQGLNEDNLYEEHWARFDDGFWRQQINDGPRARTHLDNFLVNFLVMELRKRINRKELYPIFKEYATPHEGNLPALLARFARYADNYRTLVQRIGLDSYETRFMGRLEVLTTDAILPLILYVFGEYVDERRRSMLELLEAYLIRRAMVEGEARDYGAVATAALRRIAATPDEPVQAMREQLSGFRGTASAWPTDAEVIAFARDRSMARFNRGRIRLILAIIEQGLRTARQEALTEDLDDLTLEHLMPIAWRENWPVTDSVTPAVRDRLVFTIGNLTLLTGPLNGQMGNDGWADKRKSLKASRLLLNLSLPAVWDEAAIRRRSEELAGVLVRVLPGPGEKGPRLGPDLHEEEFHDASMAEVEDETLAEELNPAEDEDDDVAPAPETVAAVQVTPPLTPPSRPAPKARSATGRTSGRGRPASEEDKMVAHILEVLGKHPPGTRLTPGQISRQASGVYDDHSPGRQRGFATLIDSGTVSGIEVTVNRHGHRAVRLARPRRVRTGA